MARVRSLAWKPLRAAGEGKKMGGGQGSVVAQGLRTQHRGCGFDPGLASGLRIQCCLELWCRLQMQPRLGMAVAVSGKGCQLQC